VLSNEAYTFIGRDFFAGRPEVAELDAFVDATEVGARKPAPEAYLVAADAREFMPQDVVFLDDTPECVEGANRVGMHGILVDPFDRTRPSTGPACSSACASPTLPRRRCSRRRRWPGSADGRRP